MSNRYLIIFNDKRASVSLQTLNQVRTYLDRSVPDITTATIYERSLDAIRNRWLIKPAKKTPSTSRSNVRWTDKENCACLKMRKAGATVPQIAQKLGRTPAAVSSRIATYCC